MPVIVVALTKTTLFGDEVRCISYHHTVESETKKRYLFALSYVFVELPKFMKVAEDLKSSEDDWLYFFANWQNSKEPPSNPLVLEAYHAMEQFNWGEAEYDAYFRARLAAEAEDLMMTKSFEEGVEQGVEQGRAEKENSKSDGVKGYGS